MKVSLTRVINIIVRFMYLNFLSSKICKQVYLFIIYCYSRRLGAKWNRYLLRLSCDFNPSLAVSFGELTSKNYWLFNNQRQKSHKWHLCFQNNFADIVPFYEWTRQHSISWNWEPNPSKNKGWVFEGKITCIFRRRKCRKFNCEYNGVRFKLYPCKNDIWAYK